MSFSTAERTALLALKGVGPTVLQRLNRWAWTVSSGCATAMPQVSSPGAALTGSSCWKNSPQAPQRSSPSCSAQPATR
nr:helix-hairpin-helix domain-containing protein [Pseudomonas aeruginosa]